MLIESPNLLLSEAARQDLIDGQLDHRLRDILELLVEHHQISVRLIKTGHPLGPVTPGGRRNDHYFHEAADLDMIDGLTVRDHNTAGPLISVGHLLMSLPTARRARVVMGPAAWHQALGEGNRTGFRDEDAANSRHADHLHIGV
ncbi:hypothetical protein Ade02nite_91840 [Paractinoplanes deccanensis]|uniref:Uncharacterized protein n=1 Tax=Paractinoplanes deccanensis TaxID=113561 RepID=A0ABQ3YKM9_9ACTN|nr:hypothetical protein [Actinoplanes deccanensis]GID80543.1 hypothetical protein Ade02nite_91840 [Actinoplanes deccanensis]